MKKAVIAAKPKPTVYCSRCKWFRRDTEGISRNAEGEYFMGVCGRGLKPDTSKKQFANKPRVCDEFMRVID